MKKIITFIAAISVLAVSCQKEDIINDETGITTGKLTATMAGRTKVSYYETEDWPDDWDWYGLQPEWEEGDEIIGFDDDGNTYTLTVEDVSEDNIATLSGTVPDGNLHLIYKHGAQASDISNKTLTVDYSSQTGDNTIPAVMLADGTVSHGSGNFAFTNAGAIIGIPYADGLPVNSNPSKITVSGENLSSATISLNGGVLTLDADEKANDAISVDCLDLTVWRYEDYIGFNKLVLIAVPVGAVITGVTVIILGEEIEPLPEETIPTTALDKEGVDYVTIAGKKWAKRNIGAVDEKDCGLYFQWGDTEGRYQYYWEEMHTWLWISAKGDVVKMVYPSGLESEPETSAGIYYLYCGDSNFEYDETLSRYVFNWRTNPFNNGSSSRDDVYFNSVINTVCPEDGTTSYIGNKDFHITVNNRTLLPAYDAAHVNWGGSWRMPTQAEFRALIAATYWVWDAEDNGYYVYTPNPATDAGKVDNGAGTYSKTNALLFFPAAGFGNESSLHDTNLGKYWSSTFISERGNGNAMIFSFHNVDPERVVYADTGTEGFVPRYYGCPIRPISD